jgi:Putative transposase, YhgA-like
MLECRLDASSARKFMSQQLANHHDAFFKKVMSEPHLAGTFLREHLPPELVELLTLECPELLPGSFVDEALAQHHSDLLFRVPLKTGDQALAYILLEHKSSPDPGTPLQLLRYIVRILTKWYQENEQFPLPVVVPQLSNMDLLTVLQYIDRGPVPVSREVLRGALHSLNQRRYEEFMGPLGHFSKEIFADGEVAGEAKALIRLLEKRFGVVPSHLRERISSADAASIEAWLDRTLEASDMPSIFQHAG